MDAHLTAAPAAAPTDLQRLDVPLSDLRRIEGQAAAMMAYIVEAREAVAARPDDHEAARRVTMAELRVRGDALALAQDLAALARPEA